MITKSRKDILKEMIQWGRNNNSTLTDFNQGSVIRSIYNAVAAVLGRIYYDTNTLFRASRIIYASGADLDIAVAARSMTRKTATAATVTVRSSKSKQSSDKERTSARLRPVVSGIR